MTKVKHVNGKKYVIIAIITAISLFFVYTLGYLCAIRFRVVHALFPDLETIDFTDFKDSREGLEKIISEFDTVVGSEEDFFNKYGTRCNVTYEGFTFFNKEKGYTTFPISSDNWYYTCQYINDFPVPGGYPEIEIYNDFKDYVIFTHRPATHRIFVYTRGEYPKKLIDSLWDEYEFVEVQRLARGWYDIRPQG